MNFPSCRRYLDSKRQRKLSLQRDRTAALIPLAQVPLAQA
jgi:hypothetical protein